MKRALTIALAVALLSSVLFAGGVAATDVQDADIDQDAEAEAEQYQDVDQNNVALQGGNVAVGGNAYNVAEQSNENTQEADVEAENDAEIDQEIDVDLDAFF